jgi:hypothetical protein
MKKNYMKIGFKLFASAMLALCLLPAKGQVFSYTFNYTGSAQSFTIPQCVQSISVDLRGSQGVTNSYGAGGMGGRVTGMYPVTAGQVLNIYIGGQPYNGGGSSGSPSGNGGGASDIRISGTALANRIFVAGGGGGAGYNCSSGQGGGAGGGTTGGTGYYCSSQSSYVGTGGTQSGGGSQVGSCVSPAANGSLGIGGNGYSSTGGGGGGGYYGGGAGCYGGGGGGSSYTDPGASSVAHSQGFQSGTGSLILSYTLNAGMIASSSATRVCSGSSATLSASNVSTYTWSTGASTVISNSASVSVSPTVTTTYTVVGTNSLGCTSTSVLSVAVDVAVPSLTIANSTTASSNGVCTGKTATLTAAGALTYTWTGGVSNGVSFVPTNTTYVVSGGNSCGTTTAAVSISIHPTPTITTVASTASLCSGTSATLTAAAVPTVPVSLWTWSHGSSNGAGFFPTVTQNYTVIGTSPLGCTASAVSSSIIVVQTPTAFPLALPGLICFGQSAQLSASGATNYTWTSIYGVVNSSVLVLTPTVAPAVINFTIVKSNANCVDTKTINLIVNALPNLLAATNPTVSCSGKTVQLQSYGGTQYTWAPMGGTTNISTATVTPVSNVTTTLIFTLTATDGTCTNSTTTQMTINPNPTITISSLSPSVCAGKCTSLSVVGADTYTWAQSGLTGTSGVQVCPPQSTNYSLTGTNAYNCTSTAQKVIVVYNNPTLTTSASPTMVCINGPSTISAGPLNQQISFAWSNSSQVYSTTVNPLNTSTYTVVGTYPNGCNSNKTIEVQVYQPTLSITGPTSTCYGGTITLTANAVNPVGNQPYSWSPNNYVFQQLTVSPTVQTVYVLTATSGINGLACSATKATTITIYVNPTITAATERTLICKNEENLLFGGGGVSYVWTGPNIAPLNGGTVVVAPTAQLTNYTVVGTDEHGCVNSTTINVRVSECQGLQEYKAGVVTVYPNPSNGEFTIRVDEPVDLTLTNELGQVVRKLSIDGNKQVNVDRLAPGVYFITGNKNGKQINQKIIISN